MIDRVTSFWKKENCFCVLFCLANKEPYVLSDTLHEKPFIFYKNCENLISLLDRALKRTIFINDKKETKNIYNIIYI